MKKIYYFTITYLLFSTAVSQAQPNNQNQGPQPDIYNNSKSKSFEGYIRFMQVTQEDTLYYKYYIKDRMVRMDSFEKFNLNEAESYILFYLDQKMVYAFKPSKKMYVNLMTKPYIPKNDDNFNIIKTNNNKKIQGYRCYQWRVRNKAQNTEVSYWVVNDNFDFFEDFLKLWNRSEKHAAYFLKIPDIKGYFPMISEERTTLREEKMTLKVLEIKKQTLSRSLFEVPTDFKNYDH